MCVCVSVWCVREAPDLDYVRAPKIRVQNSPRMPAHTGREQPPSQIPDPPTNARFVRRMEHESSADLVWIQCEFSVDLVRACVSAWCVRETPDLDYVRGPKIRVQNSPRMTGRPAWSSHFRIFPIRPRMPGSFAESSTNPVRIQCGSSVDLVWI